MRLIPYNLRACLAMGALVWAATAHGAEGDDQLIADLVAATEYQAEQAATMAVLERMAADPMSVEHIDEIVRLAMTNKGMAYRHSAKLVAAATIHSPLSEQALVYLARGLNGNLNYRQYGNVEIVKALSTTSTRLPDSVYSTLVAGLDTSRRQLQIDVLAATASDAERFASTAATFQKVIESNPIHYPMRDAAIAGLKTLSANAPLPQSTLNLLISLVQTDARVDIRVAALELLASYSFDEATEIALTDSITQAFLQPSDAWHQLHNKFAELALRATKALIQMHDSPYPSQVGDVMLLTLRGPNEFQSGAELISDYVQQQELTDDQFQRLTMWLEREQQYAPRTNVILSIPIRPLSAELLTDAHFYFANAKVDSIRIQSGYRLLYHYRETGVPKELSDMAVKYITNSATTEMAQVSLHLLMNATGGVQQYEPQIISALAMHKDNFRSYRKFLQIFVERNSDALFLKYAGNENMPSRLRTDIISLQSPGNDNKARLSPEVEESLLEITRNSKENSVVQAAGRVLEAYAVKPPMRVALKNRDNQSTALFIVFGAMLLLNILAFMVGIYAKSNIPKLDADGNVTGTRRVVPMMIWLFASAIMAILLVGALVGFIGHNSAPPPGYSFSWNVPAYIGTTIYLLSAYYSLKKHIGNADLRAAADKLPGYAASAFRLFHI
jgi:hypothetical protein